MQWLTSCIAPGTATLGADCADKHFDKEGRVGSAGTRPLRRLRAKDRHIIAHCRDGTHCRDGADVCWNCADGSGGEHCWQNAAVANQRRCFESDSSVAGV
jgi:hypothetical protein